MERGLTISVFVCLLGYSASAQDSERIDSLKQLASQSKGIERFDVLYEVVFEYIEKKDFESALHYIEIAQSEALKSTDSLKIVKSYRVKAQILWRLNRIADAIDELKVALPISQRNRYTSENKIILNWIAVSYTFQANYDLALKYHFESLVLREKDGDHQEARETLNNIGLVYFKMKNYKEALAYYTKALEHDKELTSSNFKDQLLINIGLCYNQLRDYVKAESSINAGIASCAENCSDVTLISGQFGLGVSSYGQKLYDKAKNHFRKSLAISLKVRDLRFQAENSIYLARIYLYKNSYDSALVALATTEAIAKDEGYNELLIESYKEHSKLYSLRNDYERASDYQHKYITLKDSIYSGELIERIAKITTDFQERVNIKTIADKEETIARQQALNISVALVAILACALIFVLYHSIKVKRRVNADLSDAKATIEDQNRLLRSSNVHLNQELKEKNVDLQKANDSLHRVNEELDNFIYKTSHDIRGPLASLKGMCNVALMDVKDPLALNYLSKLDITAEKLNTILTRLLIVNQINNSSLASDRIDFESIVDDILTLEKKKGLPSRLAINTTICPKTVFHSDPQFVRIILENLIDNAIKFYNDSERIDPFVNINIGGNGEYVSINVVDNGIGISEVHPDKIFQMFSRASERSETGGIGLYITKTAAEKLGGSVHLKTTPEGYTEFYVRLPYSQTSVMANGGEETVAS